MRGRNLGSQTKMTNINFGPILAINYNVSLYSQWCCGPVNLKLSFLFGKSDGKCNDRNDYFDDRFKNSLIIGLLTGGGG